MQCEVKEMLKALCIWVVWVANYVLYMYIDISITVNSFPGGKTLIKFADSADFIYTRYMY